MFSGWGIRTYASDQPGYNPIGYHTGTVWPHDTSLIAAGLQALRLRRGVEPAGRPMMEAAQRFAGLPPARSCSAASTGPMPTTPVPYPVACSPQAWAAGASFLFLETMLGLRAHADRGELELLHPHLPDWLGKVTLTDLRVGDASVDLLFHRWRGTTSAEVLRKVGDVAVTDPTLTRPRATPAAIRLPPPDRWPPRAAPRTGVERLRAARRRSRRRASTPSCCSPTPSGSIARRSSPIAEAPVGPGAAASYLASIDRRATGEPVAYMRGIKEFHGIALAVDARALIPRPETEHARRPRARRGHDAAHRRRRDRPSGRAVQVVDVGTGSGAIAIALAVALARAARARRRGRDPRRRRVARRARPRPRERRRPRRRRPGPVLGARPLPAGVADGPWDVVAANLPVRPLRCDGDRCRRRRRFEPALALDGGPDGLVVIARLLDALPRRLAPGGLALLEIGADQGDAILARPSRASARLAVRRSSRTWLGSRASAADAAEGRHDRHRRRNSRSG